MELLSLAALAITWTALLRIRPRRDRLDRDVLADLRSRALVGGNLSWMGGRR